jgi:IS5 family transposase
VHAPEVECISKGKAHKRYEFGVKASIATTNKSNFVVGGLALPGNPYDGHTLKTVLLQVRRMTGSVIEEVFVDRGYRGHGVEDLAVYISGQRRGIKTRRLRQSQKRRQAIEPVIGHLKSDGHLGRNYLKGTEGDQMNVTLSCAGHNLRLILRRLRIFLLPCLGARIWSVGYEPAAGWR